MKLIVYLLLEGGLKKMHKFISDTTALSDMTIVPLVIDAISKSEISNILFNI